MKKIIWHVSDTHGFHRDLKIPKDIDIAIFTGDATNSKNPHVNANEMQDFLSWSEQVNAKWGKIYVPGNHDTSIQEGYITKLDFEKKGIKLLHDDWIDIDGLLVWGSAWTPAFGNWAFMKSRGKLTPLYSKAPAIVDIWCQHGPPKGVLDLSINPQGLLEMCGCKELLNTVEMTLPELMLFGHIHDCKGVRNQGILKRDAITYSNATCVMDGKFEYGLTSQGNILTIER